jgi:hypothetical protein
MQSQCPICVATPQFGGVDDRRGGAGGDRRDVGREVTHAERPICAVYAY